MFHFDVTNQLYYYTLTLHSTLYTSAGCFRFVLFSSPAKAKPGQAYLPIIVIIIRLLNSILIAFRPSRARSTACLFSSARRVK